MNNTLTITGSGSEDIGRSVSARNRAAEDAARNRRLDIDAIIAAALTRLEAEAGQWPHQTTFLANYTQGVTRRPIAETDVVELIAAVRAQLSPLVRS